MLYNFGGEESDEVQVMEGGPSTTLSPAEQMMPSGVVPPIPAHWLTSEGIPVNKVCKHTDYEFEKFKRQMELYRDDNTAAAWQICLWKSGKVRVSVERSHHRNHHHHHHHRHHYDESLLLTTMYRTIIIVKLKKSG